MYTITCEHLTKTFESDRGPISPINDLSVIFEQGTINAVIGQSGCGKTTLLRMLAGLDTPSGGTIRYQGEGHEALALHFLLCCSFRPYIQVFDPF